MVVLLSVLPFVQAASYAPIEPFWSVEQLGDVHVLRKDGSLGVSNCIVPANSLPSGEAQAWGKVADTATSSLEKSTNASAAAEAAFERTLSAAAGVSVSLDAASFAGVSASYSAVSAYAPVTAKAVKWDPADCPVQRRSRTGTVVSRYYRADAIEMGFASGFEATLAAAVEAQVSEDAKVQAALDAAKSLLKNKKVASSDVVFAVDTVDYGLRQRVKKISGCDGEEKPGEAPNGDQYTVRWTDDPKHPILTWNGVEATLVGQWNNLNGYSQYARVDVAYPKDKCSTVTVKTVWLEMTEPW